MKSSRPQRPPRPTTDPADPNPGNQAEKKPAEGEGREHQHETEKKTGSRTRTFSRPHAASRVAGGPAPRHPGQPHPDPQTPPQTRAGSPGPTGSPRAPMIGEHVS